MNYGQVREYAKDKAGKILTKLAYDTSVEFINKLSSDECDWIYLHTLRELSNLTQDLIKKQQAYNDRKFNEVGK